MRQRIAVILLALLCPAFLAYGIYLGQHPQLLPESLRADEQRSEADGELLSALELIERDYYRPLSADRVRDAALQGIFEDIDDPYSHYLVGEDYDEFRQSTDGEFEGVGIQVGPVKRGLRITAVYPSSPAQRAGLRRGELITAIGDRRLAGVHPAKMTALVLGPAGSIAQLTVRNSGGQERELEIRRERLELRVARSQVLTIDGQRVGVIGLSQFSRGAAQAFARELERLQERDIDALVLDLRHNGGGLVTEATDVVSELLPADEIVVTLRGRAIETQVQRTSGDPLAPELPMVVLVDRASASAAEIVTGALADHERATVVGQRTYGKGVFQQIYQLPWGAVIDLTVGEYFTPDGNNLGGGGVRKGGGIAPTVPLDAKIVDTPAGLRAAARQAAAQAQTP